MLSIKLKSSCLGSLAKPLAFLAIIVLLPIGAIGDTSIIERAHEALSRDFRDLGEEEFAPILREKGMSEAEISKVLPKVADELATCALKVFESRTDSAIQKALRLLAETSTREEFERAMGEDLKVVDAVIFESEAETSICMERVVQENVPTN